ARRACSDPRRRSRPARRLGRARTGARGAPRRWCSLGFWTRRASAPATAGVNGDRSVSTVDARPSPRRGKSACARTRAPPGLAERAQILGGDLDRHAGWAEREQAPAVRPDAGVPWVSGLAEPVLPQRPG